MKNWIKEYLLLYKNARRFQDLAEYYEEEGHKRKRTAKACFSRAQENDSTELYWAATRMFYDATHSFNKSSLFYCKATLLLQKATCINWIIAIIFIIAGLCC